MIRIELLALLILFNFMVDSGICQSVLNTGNSIETPSEYYLQVKQFGEFINRFNYQSDWKGNRITNEFAAKVPRFNYLSYLLNQEDSRLLNESDSSYLQVCNRFFHFVCIPDSQQYISLYNGNVEAVTKASITYQGKTQSCTIYFKPEVAHNRSAKWVINKVQTNCFQSFNDSLQSYFMAPNSNETSFISAKKISALSNPVYFFSASINSDTTLIFLSEIASKRLTLNFIEKVTYRVSFTNWVITVDEFNRGTNNSGWLISNISPFTDEK